MPDYTRRGIAYPLPRDHIKNRNTQAKLAQDIRAVAETTDNAFDVEAVRTRNAIEAEGRRAQTAATQDAIIDAVAKYGHIPGRVAEVQGLVEQQDTTIGGHETRISAVELLGGLAPGDTSDATVSNVLANPGSNSSATLRSTYDLRTANNTKTYSGTTQERLTQALADGTVVQFDETFPHDGNIPNFWETPIQGSGIIHLPDGTTFSPDPVQTSTTVVTNTIYVNQQTGSSDNDGLTPDTAINNLTMAYNRVLRKLTAQQAAGAQWVVHISGEHTAATPLMSQLPDFPKGLVFRGDPPVDGKPVSTIRYTTGRIIGLYFEPGSYNITVEHLHIRDYQGTPSGYGVLMKYGGRLTVRECEFTNNGIGVGAIQNVNFTISRNTFNEGHTTGIVVQYNSTGSANYNTLDNGGSRTGTGIAISRNSVAHTDFNEIHGYSTGLLVDMASRTAAIENTFGDNENGVLVRSAGEWTNEGNVFLPTNGSTYTHMGAGREIRMHSQGNHTGTEYRLSATQTHPNYNFSRERTLTPSEIQIYSGVTAGTIPAQWFDSPGKRMRIVVHGEFLDYADFACVLPIGSIRDDNTDLQIFDNVTVPGGDPGAFRVEMILQAETMHSQFVSWEVIKNGSLNTASQIRVGSRRTNMDMSHRRLMRLHARTSAGSTTPYRVDFKYMEIFIIG